MKIPTQARPACALTPMLFAFFSILSTSLTATCTFASPFQGEELDIGIMLNWTTSSEINNSIFVIEKSEDGEDFTSIGTVSGSGNSSQITEYNFFDINIKGKYIMYRLKQVDFDGTFAYSKSLFINKEVENNFIITKISDEVTSGPFEVSIETMTNNNLRYLLMDWKNNLILNQSTFLEKGMNDLTIDLDNVNDGIYKLVLIMDGEEEELTFKVVNDPTKQNTKISTAKKD